MLEYESDETKRRFNIAKHRVDFTAMEAFEWETAVIDSDGKVSGEQRWIAKGFIRVVVHVVFYTERGDCIRIITLLKATRKEVVGYAET